MSMTSKQVAREWAIRIWKAGVAAVDSERLVRENVQVDAETITICGHRLRLNDLGRIAVVGAGKAGAGMAAGFEQAVGDELLNDKVTGLLNVPADCLRPLRKIRLQAARPAGVNEPTPEGVAGALEILEIVSQLTTQDVCVVLLSGGGSALLPAPVEGITLEQKRAVTRFLMGAGATIDELNTVRKQLSRIKGGGLARASRAGITITLIISDVVGDPLQTIASGPTVDDRSSAQQALDVLERYASRPDDIPAAVWSYLRDKASRAEIPKPIPPNVHNHIIGNNAKALAACAQEAQRLGFAVHSLGPENRGIAREEGERLAQLCLQIRDQQNPVSPPACVLSGGEPVVHLVPTDEPRKGGRNQELVLAAVRRLWDDGMSRIVLLSGGTDGEDGPTDAAGALADAQLIDEARRQGLRPEQFLAINNSYPFFERTGGLLRTGPTHTNVMDVRVALIEPPY